MVSKKKEEVNVKKCHFLLIRIKNHVNLQFKSFRMIPITPF